MENIMEIKTAKDFKNAWDVLEYPTLSRIIECLDDEILIDIHYKYPEFDYFIVKENVSPYVLDIFSDTLDNDAKFRIAMTRRILRKTFETFSRDQDYSIRKRIAYNSKCPKDILLFLSNDSDIEVASIAKSKVINGEV